MNRLAMKYVSFYLLSLIISLFFTACDETRSPPPAQPPTTAAKTKPAIQNEDENARWVLFANDTKHPSAASLEEARDMDLIQQLMDDGLYEQARVRLDKLLNQGCQHPQAYLLRAQLFYQRGELEEVIPWCNKALEASSYWIEPRMLLAQNYIRLKRLSSAENVLNDLDRLAPKLPWGPYGTGTIAAMRGDMPRAIILIDKALQRDPRHVPSLRIRAQLAAQGKDPHFEELILGRYLAEVPDSAWAHERLGELALADRRLADATRSFLRAYDLHPSTTIARRLAELAQRRNDPAEATYWQTRAGTITTPQSVPADP
jgi:tetratricopeptide (TPR) repeat protein